MSWAVKSSLCSGRLFLNVVKIARLLVTSIFLMPICAPFLCVMFPFAYTVTNFNSDRYVISFAGCKIICVR